MEWDKTKPLGSQAGYDMDDAIRDTRAGVEDFLTSMGCALDTSNPAAVTATLTVTTALIADGAVTTAKIGDGQVANAKIADGAVTSGKVADNAIPTSRITDGAVTTVKIADGAVTLAKMTGDASLEENGYAKLPGGVIIQWGKAHCLAASSVTVAFPIAFPTAHLSGCAVGVSQAQSGVIYSTVTRFNVELYSQLEQDLRWIAVGY
jgi:hypothetical protein